MYINNDLERIGIRSEEVHRLLSYVFHFTVNKKEAPLGMSGAFH